MWKTFEYANESHMLKYSRSDNSVRIHLTNLKQLWYKEEEFDAVLTNFQKFNPTLDLKTDECIEQLLNLLGRISEVDLEIRSIGSNCVQLDMKSNIAGFDSKFKIKYSVELTETTKEVFAEELTVPLVKSVKYLEEQQQRLCALLAKKDRELEEYKLEKGEISRTDLGTEKFDEKTVNCEDSKLILKTIKKETPFWKCLSEKYGDVISLVEDVSEKPWNQHVSKKLKVYSKETVKNVTGLQYKSNK